ncbi:MAG TPA: glycogen debranching protein GlgX [Spirochaetia bacterium]|nr:glycogen debranching protein GlgX [Spirochaetia bacterium]
MPLGATPTAQGTQFAVFSRHATAVSLLLFSDPQQAQPTHEIALDPRLNKTGDIWHVHVGGVGPGGLYLYRVDGPYEPEKGHRFNRNKLLLDPYVKAVTGNFTWRLADARGFDPSSPLKDLSFSTTSDVAGMPKGIVISDEFDWGGDRPLNRPLRFSVIYETHVRGLTMHQSSGAAHPGSFRGVTEKIPYFKDLGITAVELLPVQEFDELDNPHANPRTGERLQNYWGYDTISFFAPKGRYSSSGALGQQVTEFKEMVRQLHAAGIGVVLDIVFNHTAEGDQTGPTLCFRGWDNSIYYILDQSNPRYYRNYSGTGNTLNCNHPIMRSFIIDCLRYWVVEMHVDGFRFDLGSVLGRDEEGRIMANPPILERIAEEPVLRDTQIIAEAWDAAGAYQVGSFPGGRWAEWNDRFRDDVRRFWRGDPGSTSSFATRFAGSSDLYLRDGRKPFHSINFVTSHDGFTLNDLVSYATKHDEENGEDNRDGWNWNFSDNCGFEGPTDDPAIETIRNRQVKNFLATLLLSLGTPMLLGGDEMRRTQRGNNNPWCQNNEISWYDWRLSKRHADIHAFCRAMIAFRKRHPAFLRPEFYSGKNSRREAMPDITWLTEAGEPADWASDRSTLAFLIDGNKAETEADRDDNDIFIMCNASRKEVSFTLAPIPPGKEGWYRAIDTARPCGQDTAAPGAEERVSRDVLALAPRSMVVLLSK